MSIRNDVAIAIKTALFDDLTQESKDIFLEYGFSMEASIRDNQHDASLWVATDVKWYHKSHHDLQTFYYELQSCEHDHQDYLIVVTNPNDPEFNAADIGGWHENPWELSKTASISWA